MAFILIFLGFIGGCTDSDHAQKVLKQQGFTNIKITGYDFFACGRDDIYHTGFVAITRDNTVVKGTVCKGIFKSSTIRFD